MSSNQTVNFALAVVAGIVAYALTGFTSPQVGYLVFSLVSLAGGLVAGKKKGGIKDAAAGNLDIATSSEAVVVPVVFGTARLAGNMLRYDKLSFRAYPVKAKGGGKGGGGKSTTSGYDYFLVWDYGLCMGPVDAIGKILTQPGQKNGATGTTFSADYQDVLYSGDDDGGEIRIYRGSDTQTRQVGESHAVGTLAPANNYRHVCFAAFGLNLLPRSDPVDFKIGQSPAPHTYTFEITRWPKALDASDVPVPGLQTKVTSNPADPEWLDANPIAILWETFTNQIWGQGLSPDYLDTASWVAASQYCFDWKIGMSLALGEQDSVSHLYDTIRSHVDLVLAWDGSKIVAYILSDRSQMAARRKVVTKESIVGEISMTRPSWADTVNELRCEFIDRQGNYQKSIVLTQDLANLNITGGLRSKKVDFVGFTYRPTAEKQALRLLRELGTPRGQLKFTTNRFHANLRPGDLIELVWEEFNDSVVTTFWVVVDISDDDQSALGVEVSCVEDLYAQSYLGSGETFAASASPIEIASVKNTDDLYEGDDHTDPIDAGNITPICVFEPNCYMTAGKRSFFLAVERRSASLAGVNAYWALDGGSEYDPLGLFAPFAVTGVTVGSIPVGLREVDRSFEFDITLTEPADEGELLGSANKVLLTSDHIDRLLEGPHDVILIDREIMLIGKATEPVSGTYRLTNIIRGAYGTEMASHSAGATVHYMTSPFFSDYLVNAEELPVGVNVDLKFFAYSGTTGEVATGTVVNSNPWQGLGQQPFKLSRLSKSVSGPNWTLTLRPRLHDRGSGTGTTLNDDMTSLITSLPSTWGFTTQAYNGATALESPQVASGYSFVPDDGSTGAAGLVTYTRAVPGTTTRLEVRQTYLGVAGAALDV